MLDGGLGVTWATSGVWLECTTVVGSDRKSEIGRDVGVGVSSEVVVISTDEDRLKREAKLECLNFELSVRAGGCLVEFGVVETWWSADVVDEEREVSSGCSSVP